MNYQIKYRLKNQSRTHTAVFEAEYAADEAKNFIENKPVEIHHVNLDADGKKYVHKYQRTKRIGKCSKPESTESKVTIKLNDFKAKYN